MPFQFYCPQGHLLEGHESLMGQQSQCPMCGSVFVMPFMPGAAMPGPAAQPGQMPPGGWPGYGPAPGYAQAGPQAYGQPMTPSYPPGQFPPGQFAAGQFPGYPGGYGAAPGAPMPGYGQPLSEQPFTGGPTGQPLSSDGGGAGFPFIQTEQQPSAAPVSQPEPPAAAASAPAPPPAQEEKKEEPKEPRIVRIPCPQGHELQTPMDMVNQDVLCPICGTQFHLRYEDSVEFKQEQAELRRRKAESMNQAALKWSIIAAVVIVLSILGMIIYHVMSRPGEEDYKSEPEPATTESGPETSDKPAEQPEKETGDSLGTAAPTDTDSMPREEQ